MQLEQPDGFDVVQELRAALGAEDLATLEEIIHQAAAPSDGPESKLECRSAGGIYGSSCHKYLDLHLLEQVLLHRIPGFTLATEDAVVFRLLDATVKIPRSKPSILQILKQVVAVFGGPVQVEVRLYVLPGAYWPLASAVLRYECGSSQDAVRSAWDQLSEETCHSILCYIQETESDERDVLPFCGLWQMCNHRDFIPLLDMPV